MVRFGQIRLFGSCNKSHGTIIGWVTGGYTSLYLWSDRSPQCRWMTTTTTTTTKLDIGDDTAGAPARPSPEEANNEASRKPLFHGECSESLVYRPKVPYPAWDYNWDGRANTGRGPTETSQNHRSTTRHILLVRHGQYEQGFSKDKERVLTPLGRKQAELTGQRLAKMMREAMGNKNSNPSSSASAGAMQAATPCKIQSIHVSGMTRAKETASIIASYLAHPYEIVPDPALNEALPAPIIPRRLDVGTLYEQEQEIEHNHERIERAYQKYIHRADNHDDDNSSSSSDDEADDVHHHHRFEVIVCHGNIIRYFVMRALQLPPEAWLRLSLFNCSITYLMVQPNGYVTARLIGDTGHIPYEETTFSGSYGYNWAAAPTST